MTGSTPTANTLTGGLDELLLRSDGTDAWSLLMDAPGSVSALIDGLKKDSTS